jgi:hypothetical protein
VAAHGQAEERKQVRDKEVRDERGRRELQRTLSPPLFKLSFFNWSKLIFNHFILFILLFWLCGSFGLFALFCSESITCQHAPRLSLVFAIDDRFDFDRLCDLSTFPLSFGKHS